MTPDQAADLAARILAAIDADHPCPSCPGICDWSADRERVASDLAGLRLSHEDWSADSYAAWTEARHLFAAGLRRTASLYGVTE